MNSGAPQDQAAGGKIRAQEMRHQAIDINIRVIQVSATAVDHLAQIMGRNIGRHADGDTAGAIDQQIGEHGRQDHRFRGGTVIVVLEIDRVLVNIGQQHFRRLVHAYFGITHGGGPVAIHGAEIALTVQQRQAHGETLRHAHHGIVNRLITVGVITAHDVTHHAGRFAVRLVRGIACLVHGKEDAPVDWLQPVAGIGNGPGDDHAHGIIEIGFAHLVFDGDGQNGIVPLTATRRSHGWICG